MSRRQRVAGARQPAASSKLCRQRLERVPGERLYLPRPVANPLRAESIGGGMHGHQARGVDSGAVLAVGEFVRLDAKARAVELPVEQQPRPLPQPLGQPRLVEPDGLRGPRIICHGRLDDRQAAAAGPPEARRAHLDLHRGLLADPQVRQLAGLGAVAVRMRDVEQRVAQRLDPELGGRRGQSGTRAAKRRDRHIEPAGARQRPKGSSPQILQASGSPDPSARVVSAAWRTLTRGLPCSRPQQ